MTSETVIVERWKGLIKQAHMLARGERLAELRGTPYKRYDSHGLHPYSEAWGEIMALEMLAPGLRGMRDLDGIPCDPVTMRKAARREADAIYLQEAIEEQSRGATDEVEDRGTRDVVRDVAERSVRRRHIGH